MFKFQIPIDPLYLFQMFHPYAGYMANLHRSLEFEELLEFFHINIVATYEHLSGQSLLGKSISSMAYWKFYLQDRQTDSTAPGYMNSNEFMTFLKQFRLGRSQDNFLGHEDFQKEFEFLASCEKFSLNEQITPFDFYRLIFLERNF
jgi:hypothetical protein